MGALDCGQAPTIGNTEEFTRFASSWVSRTILVGAILFDGVELNLKKLQPLMLSENALNTSNFRRLLVAIVLMPICIIVGQLRAQVECVFSDTG